MSSWPSGRLRSRTITSSSRSGSIFSPFYQHTSTSPRDHIRPTRSHQLSSTYRLPAPDRHVLAIINFQALTDLSTRSDFTPDNVDFLTSLTLNAGFTQTPSRRFRYLLGAAILITMKFHMYPSATSAILFRHESVKLGTSVFQDTLWNFVAQIIEEKPLK